MGYILSLHCSEVEVWVTSSPLYVLSFLRILGTIQELAESTDMGFSSVSSILISRECTGSATHFCSRHAGGRSQVAGRVCSPDITGTSSERLWTESLALSYKQLQPLGGANSLQETSLPVFRTWQCRYSYRRRYLH